jgi:hypothetical protein
LKKVDLDFAPHGIGLQPLDHCTGLTALHLQECVVGYREAASAAIAALRQLQKLIINFTRDKQGWCPVINLGRFSTLTHLSLKPTLQWANARYGAERCRTVSADYEQQLCQLSALVNLEHLELGRFTFAQLPAGLPTQLSKLTCLDVSLAMHGWDAAAVQLRSYSRLTTLQQLTLACDCHWYDDDGALEDSIAQLSQLTSLELVTQGKEYDSTAAKAWARLPALHRLALKSCAVDPGALAELTQLRALTLDTMNISSWRLADLLADVSHLTLLTQLSLEVLDTGDEEESFPHASAFTALTASTGFVFVAAAPGQQRSQGDPRRLGLAEVWHYLPTPALDRPTLLLHAWLSNQ